MAHRQIAISYILATIVFVFLARSFSVAQTDRPTTLMVGQECPDIFLHNLTTFDDDSVSIRRFRGKWLLLEFWDPSCLPCIRSFPKLDSLQREFSDSLTIVLVGHNEQASRNLISKFKARYNLTLAAAFDNKLFRMFGISSVPLVAIIDDRGVVRSLKFPEELNSNTLSAMIKGDATLLSTPEFDPIAASFDIMKPLLIAGNGGPDTTFLQRSVLMKWNPSIPARAFSHVSASMYGNHVQQCGRAIEWLYYFAYKDTIYSYPSTEHDGILDNYGEYWMQPIIKVADPDKFKLTPGTAEGFYCYSLVVPKEKATTRYIQRAVQTDLFNYFGYVGEVATRKMPCWYLKVSSDARKTLTTKGGEQVYEDNGYAGFTFVNVPVKEIIVRLWGVEQLGPPFIDATGITGNIDISIDTDLSNFDGFRKALKEKGIELVPGKKKMKVITIRDP
ncbi:MAG TPA: TlpA disulfide reductase family protein [Chryseolinea sp.]|nr:TlpA disulfide reductase family protein [Chryseolinea sp.]